LCVVGNRMLKGTFWVKVGRGLVVHVARIGRRKMYAVFCGIYEGNTTGW
jgi:hypothetical protein